MVKVGDKVRFLNSTGGGTVRKFQSKNIVLVEEEDGFETPVLTSDIVVVEETNEYNFVKGTPHKDVPEANKAVPERAGQKYEPVDFEETADGEQLSVMLAFVPTDVRKLQESKFDMYIVNDSNYYVNFVIAVEDEHGQLNARHADMVEPQTKLLLETLSYDDLNDLQNMRVQAVAYKKHSYDFKPAIDTPLTLRLTRFFKMHSFVENDFFDEPALIENIVRRDFSVADMLAAPTSEQKPKPQRERISKPNQKPELIEIDLHINELIDNTNGLQPKDMLDYQIEKFNEVMKANLKRKGTKIVFIHGKGEGKLRAEILRNLKLYYPACTAQDANFQKYGFGATMVTIH